MGITEWTVGILVFNIIVVILLIGTSDLIISNYNTDIIEDSNMTSTDTIDANDLNFIEKFFWSIAGLPFYISLILSIPNIIFAIVILNWIRGVN